MPLSLHEFAGFRWVDWDSNAKKRFIAGAINSHEAESTFATLILSGVLERFPGLKVVAAELNCGWLAYFLNRIDGHAATRALRVHGSAFSTRLTMSPREYFNRQLYATFINDPYGIAPPRDRRRQHHVVVGLPAQRNFLAALARKNR
jgi:predicted TIM-barrel fold metal-dependent hydrolase